MRSKRPPRVRTRAGAHAGVGRGEHLDYSALALPLEIRNMIQLLSKAARRERMGYGNTEDAISVLAIS